jgi:transposase
VPRPTLSHCEIVKGPRVEQLIRAAIAALRYLPSYSPDMTPIESAFSKLKAFQRRITERNIPA